MKKLLFPILAATFIVPAISMVSCNKSTDDPVDPIESIEMGFSTEHEGLVASDFAFELNKTFAFSIDLSKATDEWYESIPNDGLAFACMAQTAPKNEGALYGIDVTKAKVSINGTERTLGNGWNIGSESYGYNAFIEIGDSDHQLNRSDKIDFIVAWNYAGDGWSDPVVVLLPNE